jgi:hypothetical protein
MGLYQLFSVAKLLCGQAEILRQCDGRLQPVFRFSIGVADVNVHSWLLAREEKQPECAILDDRWSHGWILGS